MTHKYESQCWNCGSRNMERLPTYVKCRDCGTTFNEVLTPGYPVVLEVSGKKEMGTDSGRETRYRPHGALARSVARKRGQKVEPGKEK